MTNLLKKIRNTKRRIGRKLSGSHPHDLAWYICTGDGLEIGARNNPYPFPNAKVQYADIGNDLAIRNIAESHGASSQGSKYTYVDYILQPPRFAFESIGNNQFDFVFSDNVLEHTSNPIFVLSEQYRIIKCGGVIYCIIPNKNFTFDRSRTPTSLEVFIEKYNNNIFSHTIEEALDEILNRTDLPAFHFEVEDQIKYANEMIQNNDGAPHYFVFDAKNTYQLINYFLSFHDGYLEHFSALNGKNIHFTIRKNR